MYETELKELNRKGVRYLIIGGVALAFYDFPRATFDLDLLVDLSDNNIGFVIDALTALGYVPRAPVDPRYLQDQNKRQEWIADKNLRAFTFIKPDNPGLSVDLLIAHHLDFSECFDRKNIFAVGGEAANVAAISDLLVLKKASGRPQDQRDIAALEAKWGEER